MVMLCFDEEGLRKAISKEPRHRQLAFALAASGRLLPYYTEYCRISDLSPDPRPFEYLSQLWRVALKEEKPEPLHVMKARDKALLEIIPCEDGPWNQRHPQAEDAVAALAFSNRTIMDDDPQNAIYAARRAYHSADQFAIHNLNCDFSEPDFEKMLLMHDVVQRELERQERDLALVRTGDIEKMKTLSESEALLDGYCSKT